jgi:hypothetical protein
VDIEAWISRHGVSASTLSRRASTFSRFFVSLRAIVIQ